MTPSALGLQRVGDQARVSVPPAVFFHLGVFTGLYGLGSSWLADVSKAHKALRLWVHFYRFVALRDAAYRIVLDALFHISKNDTNPLDL